MSSIKDEIRAAIDKLKLSDDAFRKLPDSEGEAVYRRALREFVVDGEPRWWWEHFISDTSVEFPKGDGWRHIAEFVPDVNEHVWFIVEDESLPFYPVYDAVASSIGAVIGECYGFEYYIVDHDFRWLLCENHHNRMIGVGRVVEDRLNRWQTRPL